MSILSYFNETKAEMQNVVWPKNKQVITFTILVVIIAVGTAYVLGLFDIVFSRLLALLIA